MLCMRVCKKHSLLIMVAVLLLTLLSLSTIILSLAEIDLSIDCGATKSYVDSDKVRWLEDKGFVTAGESFKFLGTNVPGHFKNLRYFPSGQTNCYTNIPATKGGKTLVRTVFYYGNYDKKLSPPSFDVLYDRKHRDSVVNVKMRISEAIFAPASKNISVCLIRTSPSDDPFISSIEVYSLDAGMYDDLGPDEGLISRQRFAYAAKEPRYPLDPYGRIWYQSSSYESTVTELATSAPSIDISGASNKPPEIVMSKALSTPELTIPIEAPPSLDGIPIYLALYFSEPQSLARTRSFNISFGTKQVGPIVPVFGKATQVVVRDVMATSTSEVLFQSTGKSTLSPIINALEVYSISKGNGRQSGSSHDWGDLKPRRKKPKGVPADYLEKVKNAKQMQQGAKPNKPKLPLILGVTLSSTFVALSSACAAFFFKKRSNAKPNPNTLPTTSTGNERGISPLVGQQLASDVSHPPRTG